MFYSQFILAKKGPLGNIWIAAHLERKLRKNQVADTDIGVSVDSILSPDVPIALRLSSHLLLGVARIYSRKVNYLFDDCSDALLSVKQTFRSAAVDLPPEESKAPYNSITLPETFDLDDFDLPDNDISQGNFVDHHISSRDQITLQDNIEGTGYSTSKFGLDERFGDGDASGLDLDEELLLDNIGTTRRAHESSDPQASVVTTTTLTPNEHLETTAFNLGTMVDDDGDDDDDCGDPMDYAQAPSTPGLVEEPNLLSNAHQEVSDHLETECPLVDPNMTENTKNNTCNTYGDKQEVDWCSHDNNANSDAIPIEAVVEHGSMDVKPIFDLSLNLDLESADKTDKSSDFDKPNDDHQDPNEIVLEKSDFEISEGDLERKLNLDVGEKIASIENIFLRPCNNSNIEKNDAAFGCVKSTDFDVQSDVAALENSGREETEMLGEACCVTDHSEGILKENNEQEHPSQEEVFAASSEPNSQLHNANSHDELAKNLNNSTETELPAPEKLLSLPEGHMDLNCGVFVGLDEGDAGSKIVSGMKRSFTESTLPEQSLNSVESSRLVRCKRTVETVPDDNDLLSSILVGKSSVLKVKRTPRLSVVTSMKRKRSAPRTGATKRKMIMDEMMVLHGDTIRQQLTNTEKTRRVRKKAPCTRTDISMIQKQYLEDAIFLQPIFTGMSRELVSLHGQTCDISGITVVKNDVNSSISLEHVAEMRLPSENNKNAIETMFEPILASHEVKNDHPLETASEPHITSQNVETKEADKINEEISVSGEHTKPIADMEADISQLETLLDVTDVQISENDDNPVNIITDIASADRVQSGCIVETVDTNTSVGDDLSTVQKTDVSSVELGSAVMDVVVDNTHTISQNEFTTGFFVETVDTNTSVGDDLSAVQKTDVSSVEFGSAVRDVDNGHRISQNEFTTGFIVETVDTNTSVGDDLSAVQKTDVSSVELGSAVMDVVVDNRHTISQNEFTTGFFVETLDTNTSVGDDLSAVQKTDVSSVEFGSAVRDVDNGHTISQNEFTTVNDDDIDARVEYEPEARDGDALQKMERNEHGEIRSIISEDGFVINDENNREEMEAYERYTVDAEVSGFDMHDREELNYSAAENDTEFLNVDDDELNEIGDDYIPDDDDEEERFIENTGWSSRTRAVSKYLQTLFVKEANFGNETLSLDNLLIGKSRKEASRMFFEALVLKTRDYIHVEQRHPFDDVSIKPGTRLMKSDF